MTSTRGFFDQLKATRDAVGLIMGVDSRTSSKELRALANSDLVGAAAVFKALLDKGVLTDADVSAAIGGAVSGDGSFWDPEPETPTDALAAAWSTFPGEDFEGGVNGIDATDLNTAFAGGQVGDSLLAIDGSVTFDSSTARSGSLSMKTITANGTWRGLQTATYESTATLFTRFYFKASAVPPDVDGVRVLSLYPGDISGGPSFELGIDGGGGPGVFLTGGVGRIDATMPNVCNGSWWRVETGIYETTLLTGSEVRLYTGANLTGTTIDHDFQTDYDGSRVTSAVIGQSGSRLVSGGFTCRMDDVAFSDSGWVGP